LQLTIVGKEKSKQGDQEGRLKVIVLFEKTIAEAALAAEVDYMGICDDYIVHTLHIFGDGEVEL
jgi:hypothetical protein